MPPFQPFRGTKRRRDGQRCMGKLPPELKGPWRMYTICRAKKHYWVTGMEGVSKDAKNAHVFDDVALLKACAELVGNLYANPTLLFIESVED